MTAFPLANSSSFARLNSRKFYLFAFTITVRSLLRNLQAYCCRPPPLRRQRDGNPHSLPSWTPMRLLYLLLQRRQTITSIFIGTTSSPNCGTLFASLTKTSWSMNWPWPNRLAQLKSGKFYEKNKRWLHQNSGYLVADGNLKVAMPAVLFSDQILSGAYFWSRFPQRLRIVVFGSSKRYIC